MASVIRYTNIALFPHLKKGLISFMFSILKSGILHLARISEGF